MIKYRIISALCYLGMVVLNIIYNIFLLLFFPILLIGSFVWNHNKFWDINRFLIDKVQDMPKFENKEK